jgi:hypothetical protein
VCFSLNISDIASGVACICFKLSISDIASI